MSKRPSDAVQALVAEVVDLQARRLAAIEGEDEARQEFVAARKALDARVAFRTEVATRETLTRDALAIIQKRDEITDETITALLARAAR